MTAPELKPCPFCGGEDIHNWGESTWSRPIKWMYCTECQSQGPRVMLGRDEEGDASFHGAIAAWNTRADLPPPLSAALALPEIAALVGLLREARADLAGYVEADWPETQRSQYPPLQAKWKRDMALCWAIDTALAALQEKP